MRRKRDGCLWRMVISLFVLGLLYPAAPMAAQVPNPALTRAYAFYRKWDSNFTGAMLTMQAPTQDYQIPGTTPSGCVFYPTWIGYSSDNWVEIGLQKCRNSSGPSTPTGYYEVYGYWSASPTSRAFIPELNTIRVPTGGLVDLHLMTDGTGKWKWVVNGIVRAERTQTAWQGQTTRFTVGVEGHSPAFAPRDARAFNMVVQQGVNTPYRPIAGWTATMDNNPERYGIWQNNGRADDISMSGLGLPNRTGWAGPDVFGLATKNMGVMLYDNGLTAVKFAGQQGIDLAQNYTGPDGQTNADMWGFHQSDRAEYMLKVPTNPVKVAFITVADRPGPVTISIFVNGVYRGQAHFDNNDNNRHLRIVTLNVPGLVLGKPYTFTFEFVNDYSQPGGADSDRNMLLDTVATIS